MTGVLRAKVGGNWVDVIGGAPQQPDWYNALGVRVIAPHIGNVTIPASNVAYVTGRLNFTTVIGRRYRIHWHCRAIGITTTGDTALAFNLFDGSTNTNLIGDWHNSRLNYDNVDLFTLLDGDGLAHSWAIQATTDTHTAITVFDDSGPFYIEDVGPNTAIGPAAPLTVPPPVWTPLTLASGWTARSTAPPQYRLIGDMVQLRGRMLGTATLTTIFTMPAGFRPASDILTPVGVINTGWVPSGLLFIDPPSGQAIMQTQPHTEVSLSGISYSITP